MRSWTDFRQTMRTEDPIFDFARRGDLESLRELRLDPAKINARDSRGHSPLMLAAYNGNFAVAEYLLDQGAEVDSVDNAGSTVLMGAAFKGDRAMIELLIRRGANPRATNLQQKTALNFAESFGRIDAVAYLKQLLEEV